MTPRRRRIPDGPTASEPERSRASAPVRGGSVLPHVQAFADAVSEATGASSIGTYPGHDPSIDRALDIFVPTTSRALGDSICSFVLANVDRYGVRYVIYRKHIWHRLDPRWASMEDRGSPTQNHLDHVHISFESAPSAGPPPVPPVPAPQEEPTMFVFDAPAERGGGVWVSDGVTRKPVRTGETWPALEAAGARHIGVAPVGLFDDLLDIEAALRDTRDVQRGALGLDDLAARVADLLAARLAG